MKNSRLIAALLAATMVISSVLAQEAPQEASKGRLKTVRKQFNESLDRFKRCMQFKCTRWEALKVARDLTIAAVAVVGVMYGVEAWVKAREAERESLISSETEKKRRQEEVMEQLKKEFPVDTKVKVPGHEELFFVRNYQWYPGPGRKPGPIVAVSPLSGKAEGWYEPYQLTKVGE